MSAAADSPCGVCGAATSDVLLLTGLTIARCSSCGHRQTRLAPGAAPERYGADYFLDTHRNWFAHPNLLLFKRIDSELLRALPGWAAGRAAVADVGCGNGAFLRFLARRRPGLSLTGLDLSDAGADGPYEFVRRDFSGWEPGPRFDAVVSLAVVEHIPDIADFAARAAAAARPGGVVVLMTVESDSFIYRLAEILAGLGLRTPAARLYDKHHLHHFTRGSLARLLSAQGLAPVCSFSHNFPVEAVDLPAHLGPAGRAAARAGVRALFAADFAFRPMLQTVIYRKASLPRRTG